MVKIEPRAGDPQRTLISQLGDVHPDPYKDSPHGYHVNRGKRSIVLDLETEAGMRVLHALLDKSDVFLSNYHAAALRSLGLDAEAVLARHPRLVVCPMTGCGLQGPDADGPVYDVASFWSRSGAAFAHTGNDGFPAILAPGFGDMVTGLAAVGGICAALVERMRTGKGRALTTNLLRTGLHCNTWAMSTYFALGRPVKWGKRDGTGNPLATVYKAKDDKVFWIIGFEAARHWPTTVRAVGRPEWLEDPRYKTPADRRKNEKELVRKLDEIFATRTRAEWAAIFNKEELWWAPVQDPAELSLDTQAHAAGAFLDAPLSARAVAAGRTQVRMAAPPVDFLGGPRIGPRRPSPELGEHTAEVLQELGLDVETKQSVLEAVPGQRSKL